MGRVRNPWRAFLAAVVSAGVVGCTLVPAHVQRSDGFAGPGTAYRKVLDTRTRKVELYDGFATVAKGWATWRSPDLREILAEASVAAFHLEGDEAARVRREESRAARRVREFHLALYTPKKDWNDLESPGTLWKVYLEVPGGEKLHPLRIVALEKSDKVPIEYPYVTPWTREYSLFFPLVEGEETAEHPVLEVVGPLGALRFSF